MQPQTSTPTPAANVQPALSSDYEKILNWLFPLAERQFDRWESLMNAGNANAIITSAEPMAMDDMEALERAKWERINPLGWSSFSN